MDLDLSVWEYTYGVYIAANSVSNIVVSMASISSHRTLPGLVCESYLDLGWNWSYGSAMSVLIG